MPQKKQPDTLKITYLTFKIRTQAYLAAYFKSRWTMEPYLINDIDSAGQYIISILRNQPPKYRYRGAKRLDGVIEARISVSLAEKVGCEFNNSQTYFFNEWLKARFDEDMFLLIEFARSHNMKMKAAVEYAMDFMNIAEGMNYMSIRKHYYRIRKQKEEKEKRGCS